MKQPPAFQFYAQDFLSSAIIAIMTAEEVGGYTMLLAYSWTQAKPCYLPNDEKTLQVLSKLSPENFSKSKSIILKNFKEKGDFIYNEKLLGIYKDLIKRRKSMSDNGKKGGRPKKPKQSNSFSENNQKLNSAKADESPSSSSSSSSSSSKTAGIKTDTETAGLDCSKKNGGKPKWSAHKQALALIADQNPLAFDPDGSEFDSATATFYASLLANKDITLDERRLRAYHLQAFKPAKSKPKAWYIRCAGDTEIVPAKWAMDTAKADMTRDHEKQRRENAGNENISEFNRTVARMNKQLRAE